MPAAGNDIVSCVFHRFPCLFVIKGIKKACPAFPVWYWGCFCQIAPNRAKRVPDGLFIHFVQTRPKITTWTDTGDNKAFRLPIRTNRFHSRKGLEGTAVFTEIKKRLSFDKTPRSCFSHSQLCRHSPLTSAIQRNLCLFSVNNFWLAFADI